MYTYLFLTSNGIRYMLRYNVETTEISVLKNFIKTSNNLMKEETRIFNVPFVLLFIPVSFFLNLTFMSCMKIKMIYYYYIFYPKL